MNAEENEIREYPGKSGIQILLMIGIGALAGLMLIQMLNFGWLMVALFLVLIVLLIVSLDSYKAWIIMLAVSTFSGFKYTAGTYTFRPDQVALLLLISGWIFALLAGKTRLHKVPLLVPAALYLAVNFISSGLYAPDKGASYQAALLLGIYVLMYVMTVMVLQDYPEKLKTVIKAILVIGVIQTIYALISYVGQKAGVNLGGIDEKQLTYVSEVRDAFSLRGGFEEANLLGAFEAAVGLIFLALLTSSKVAIKSKLAYPALALILLALGLSYTRAAWVGFMVGMILIIFLQKPERNVFNPRAAAAVLGIVIVTVTIAFPFANTLTSGVLGGRASKLLQFESGSAADRVTVQQVAIERWQQSQLLGFGTLSLPAELAKPSPAGGWLYSSFIQALHDTGIVGLAILIWFDIGILVIINRAYKKTKDPFYRAVLAGFAASTVALIIASQASSFLWLGFFWIYSGIAVAAAQIAIKEADRQSAEIK